MYCPNCGNQNSLDQKFCRSCGLSLDTICQVVSHELQETKRAAVSPNSSISLRGLWQSAWYYGFFLIAIGLIIISVGKKVIGEQLVADIGTVMSFVGLGFLVARGLLLLRASGAPTQASGLPKADTTTPLHEGKEQPSITEFTTRNFDPVYAERRDPETSKSRLSSDSKHS